MELGLSLGHASKFSEKISKNDQQQKNSFGNGGLDFYMSLGLINSHSEIEKTQKNLDGDEDDDRINTSRESPVQLDLLPLAPVHRRISFDNGSSENGSSENAAAKGLQRIPAAAEEASSANSVGCLDLGVCGSKRGFEGKGNDAVVESSRSGGDGDDDDDDENGANTRKKLRLSKEQSAFLEDCFIQHHTLNPKQKLALAKQLNLRPRQVEVWFQNRRARTKLKQTEVDCEYLKRCCETLTDENRRLQKELQELRALKVSNPYCMQSPPTTLTMCPSCEHIAAAGNGKIARNDHTIPKPIPFPLSRPKFFPFSQSSIHPNQPAAS